MTATAQHRHTHAPKLTPSDLAKLQGAGAYALYVSALPVIREASFTPLTESVVTKLPDGRYRVRAKGQHCGIKNRNGRIYPADTTWGPHTRPDALFMQKVRARRVIGQLEHPDSGKSSMSLGAIVITRVEAPDPITGEVWIEFETMSTPMGLIAAAYIKDGVGFGISSRGNGTVQRSADGIDIVQADFEPYTFDLVIDESTPGAEVFSQKIREAYHVLVTQAGGDLGRARVLAEAQVIAACQRDGFVIHEGVVSCECKGEGEHAVCACKVTRVCEGAEEPAKGYREFLLALPDGTGRYEAYDNGVAQWDVWFLAHNLPPEKIATSMPTLIHAKKTAEMHMSRILPGRAPMTGGVPGNPSPTSLGPFAAGQTADAPTGNITLTIARESVSESAPITRGNFKRAGVDGPYDTVKKGYIVGGVFGFPEIPNLTMGATFAITHIPTGMVVTRVKTQREALVMSQRLFAIPGVPWKSKKTDEIMKFKDAVAAVLNGPRESVAVGVLAALAKGLRENSPAKSSAQGKRRTP